MQRSRKARRMGGEEKPKSTDRSVCATKAGLDGVVFHGGGEAGEVLAGGGAFDLDAKLVFVF